MEAGIAAFISRGTPSGWTLCVLALAGVILLARIHFTQAPQMRQLDISEGGILREAIAAEMKGLRDEVAGLREENTNLRAEVRALHGVIDGMRREALTGQLAVQTVVARELGDAVPPATRAALNSLDAINGGGE